MKIKVVELFAGVGGFRLGLERSSNQFETIWANQWEPGKKLQHAYNCYISHFNNCINEDIAKVKNQVPDHDLLVGGFPCQDYSVARTGAEGIQGKKGVLWWDIRDIVEDKRPKYILLENVDRLLKSPTKQRGRDFGIILKCLSDLGYAVEWRVINAAEYGCAQRRRRIYIFATYNTTTFYEFLQNKGRQETLYINGFFAQEFPVKFSFEKRKVYEIDEPLELISERFTAKFYNSGLCINNKIYTIESIPFFEESITLKQICEDNVDKRFFLKGNLEKWEYLKGYKRIKRQKPNGETYFYSEGKMAFPDRMDMPSRTILTSESSLNRSTHVVTDKKTGKLRLLTPVECERLNGFDDNWTDTGMPEKFRYFCMGNALVVPIIERIGKRIVDINSSLQEPL